jgi:hypothetical protein
MSNKIKIKGGPEFFTVTDENGNKILTQEATLDMMDGTKPMTANLKVYVDEIDLDISEYKLEYLDDWVRPLLLINSFVKSHVNELLQKEMANYYICILAQARRENPFATLEMKNNPPKLVLKL